MTNKAGGVAAVDRALTILDTFKDNDGNELSLANLAAETGFYKSTILRLLVSLENFGYIRQLENGRYKLGHTLSRLGGMYQASFHLEEFIKPRLEAIVNQCNESASFLVRQNDHQQVLFRCDTSQRVRDHLRVGDQIPLSEGGASVKIIKQYENFAAGSLKPADFCAFSFGERNPEMAGIAAPVFDGNTGFIGAISVTGPLFRVNKKTSKEFAAILTSEAIKLSLKLGASRKIFEDFKLDKIIDQ